jgi:hypothetical protein
MNKADAYCTGCAFAHDPKKLNAPPATVEKYGMNTLAFAVVLMMTV